MNTFGLDTVILADVIILLEVHTSHVSTTKWTFEGSFLCIFNLWTQ
jgi:hypothetical protein